MISIFRGLDSCSFMVFSIQIDLNMISVFIQDVPPNACQYRNPVSILFPMTCPFDSPLYVCFSVTYSLNPMPKP